MAASIRHPGRSTALPPANGPPGMSLNVPGMSTTVTSQPATLSFLVAALSLVAEPSGWLNCPYQRSMLASIVPPAPMTVMRPGASPFAAGMANSVSIMLLLGCTRSQPAGASSEKAPSAIVKTRSAAATAGWAAAGPRGTPPIAAPTRATTRTDVGW